MLAAATAVNYVLFGTLASCYCVASFFSLTTSSMLANAVYHGMTFAVVCTSFALIYVQNLMLCALIGVVTFLVIFALSGARQNHLVNHTIDWLVRRRTHV